MWKKYIIMCSYNESYVSVTYTTLLFYAVLFKDALSDNVINR